MYNVSADYLNQIKQPEQERRLSGTIGNKSFTSEDVLAGSFSINSEAINKNDIKYGYCGITTASITLFNSFASQIPRASYRGLILTPSVALKVGNNWESVPCGVFTIDEAVWSEIGVTLTAYDNMTKFDKSLTLTQTYGKPYDLLNLACAACGVTLGNTRAEIEAMPNGNTQGGIYPENDMETWRDLIYWVSQLLGGFATCDRSGHLVIRQFGNDTGVTLGTAHRFTGMKLSDYVTSYTGVSVVNIEDNSLVYRGAEIDNGLTMNLGSNPLLQDSDVQSNRLDTLVDALEDFAYTPFTAKLIGDMCFDLGDVIHFEDGISVGDDCCIMAYDYVYGKEYTAKGYGDNPALATARSKADKNLAVVQSKTKQNVLEMRMFVNAEEIELAEDVSETVISLEFTTVNDTSVSVFHEIQIECLSDDMSVEVTYMLNEEEITYHPVETWSEAGLHILSLMYFMQVDGDSVYDWNVILKVSGGDAVIDVNNARACLQGQGLAAVSKWNGKIEVRDNIGLLGLPTTAEGILALVESVSGEAQSPSGDLITEQIGLITIDGTAVAVMGMTDQVMFLRPLSELTWNQAHSYTWDVLNDGWCWGFVNE